MSGSSELQDPVALGATGSCHIRARRPSSARSDGCADADYDGPMRPPDTHPSPTHRPVVGAALLVAAVLALGACNGTAQPPGPNGSSAPPPSTQSPPTAAPNPSPGASGSVLPVGQTDSDWGRIWDRLPAAFPVYPGAAPAEAAQTGPVSALLAVPDQATRTVATWMQAELERLGYRTEALNGPLEDGGFVLDSVGDAGCRVEVAVAPLGNLTTLTVRYGAACPSP